MKTYSYLVIGRTKKGAKFSHVTEASDANEALQAASPYINEQRQKRDKIISWSIVRGECLWEGGAR